MRGGITRGLIRNTVLGIDRLFADALHFSVCTFCSFFIFFPSFILYHYLDWVDICYYRGASFLSFFFRFFFFLYKDKISACICKMLVQIFIQTRNKNIHLWKVTKIVASLFKFNKNILSSLFLLLFRIELILRNALFIEFRIRIL